MASLQCVSACGLPSGARTQRRMGTAGSGEAFLLGEKIREFITSIFYCDVNRGNHYVCNIRFIIVKLDDRGKRKGTISYRSGVFTGSKIQWEN